MPESEVAMADVFLIEEVRSEKAREQRDRIVDGLMGLIERARAGEIIGVCFAAIPSDRQTLCVGALKHDSCGAHELVGASSMLANYIDEAARSP
jgi:hypothetical protein